MKSFVFVVALLALLLLIFGNMAYAEEEYYLKVVNKGNKVIVCKDIEFKVHSINDIVKPNSVKTTKKQKNANPFDKIINGKY